MDQNAEQLCRAAQAGDRGAASNLIELFYERIFCYFRRLCGNEDDAADLTQKTFVKTWTSLPSFQARSSFSTWIHGIAHHTYVDWRRKKNFIDPQNEDWWETCAEAGPGPFEHTADRDLARQLYAAVEQLDDEARQIVHLHYYQGLSLQETADILKIATSTVKYRLRNALDFLKAQTAEPKLRPG
jgi:RNA polymerase sigma-70 factor (ECF subfamily)